MRIVFRMYTDRLVPSELIKANQESDKDVMESYGKIEEVIGRDKFVSGNKMVTIFEMYQELTEKK